jgi:hypothetical protein
VLLLFVVSFSGCQPIKGDVSDFMSPPKLTAEQQSIENALNLILGTGKFQLKYPIKGDYRSAFILHNLDSDSGDEAIAFYCPITDNAGTHVMILKKIKNKWQKVNDFNGNGNDVDEIAFGNFYGNGYDNIAIAWTQLTGTDLGLSVYSISGIKYTCVNAFTNMKIVNLNGDNMQDVLLLKLDQTASLISDKDGVLTEIGTAPMDAKVSSYAGIYPTKVDNQNAVLVDGYKGQHGMVTELLTWGNGTLKSPFLDKNQITFTTMLRDVPITCENFFNDGQYEIPSAVELPGYGSITDFSKKLWLVSWSEVSNGALSTPPKFSCVMNNNEGYYFIVPQKWETNGKISTDNISVTVDNSTGDNRWDFNVWDGSKMTHLLFSIVVYTESDWNGNHASGSNLSNTYEIADNNGLVFAAALNPKTSSDPKYLDIGSIKSNFKLILS